MGKIEGLLSLKNGDAVRGVVSRRLWCWRFFKVENATVIERVSSNRAECDGIMWVPKSNVLLLQQLIKVEA